MAGRRLIVLDDGLPVALAAELAARGRPADTVGALGLADGSDEAVLAAVAALGGILVTPHPPGATVPGAAVAHVAVRGVSARRDAVHRHAAAIAAQRRDLARYV